LINFNNAKAILKTIKELTKAVDAYRKALLKYLAGYDGRVLREFEKTLRCTTHGRIL